jgi:hypothetical protein
MFCYSIVDEFAAYERYFKNQRIHPNIAVQKVFHIKKQEVILGFFEVTEDYLMDTLVKRPDLVTEQNVSQKKIRPDLKIRLESIHCSIN